MNCELRSRRKAKKNAKTNRKRRKKKEEFVTSKLRVTENEGAQKRGSHPRKRKSPPVGGWEKKRKTQVHAQPRIKEIPGYCTLKVRPPKFAPVWRSALKIGASWARKDAVGALERLQVEKNVRFGKGVERSHSIASKYRAKSGFFDLELSKEKAT